MLKGAKPQNISTGAPLSSMNTCHPFTAVALCVCVCSRMLAQALSKKPPLGGLGGGRGEGKDERREREKPGVCVEG